MGAPLVLHKSWDWPQQEYGVQPVSFLLWVLPYITYALREKWSRIYIWGRGSQMNVLPTNTNLYIHVAYITIKKIPRISRLLNNWPAEGKR